MGRTALHKVVLRDVSSLQDAPCAPGVFLSPWPLDLVILEEVAVGGLPLEPDPRNIRQRLAVIFVPLLWQFELPELLLVTARSVEGHFRLPVDGMGVVADFGGSGSLKIFLICASPLKFSRRVESVIGYQLPDFEIGVLWVDRMLQIKRFKLLLIGTVPDKGNVRSHYASLNSGGGYSYVLQSGGSELLVVVGLGRNEGFFVSGLQGLGVVVTVLVLVGCWGGDCYFLMDGFVLAGVRGRELPLDVRPGTSVLAYLRGTIPQLQS